MLTAHVRVGTFAASEQAKIQVRDNALVFLDSPPSETRNATETICWWIAGSSSITDTHLEYRNSRSETPTALPAHTGLAPAHFCDDVPLGTTGKALINAVVHTPTTMDEVGSEHVIERHVIFSATMLSLSPFVAPGQSMNVCWNTTGFGRLDQVWLYTGTNPSTMAPALMAPSPSVGTRFCKAISAPASGSLYVQARVKGPFDDVWTTVESTQVATLASIQLGTPPRVVAPGSTFSVCFSATGVGPQIESLLVSEILTPPQDPIAHSSSFGTGTHCDTVTAPLDGSVIYYAYGSSPTNERQTKVGQTHVSRMDAASLVANPPYAQAGVPFSVCWTVSGVGRLDDSYLMVRPAGSTTWTRTSQNAGFIHGEAGYCAWIRPGAAPFVDYHAVAVGPFQTVSTAIGTTQIRQLHSVAVSSQSGMVGRVGLLPTENVNICWHVKGLGAVTNTHLEYGPTASLGTGTPVQSGSAPGNYCATVPMPADGSSLKIRLTAVSATNTVHSRIQDLVGMRDCLTQSPTFP